MPQNSEEPKMSAVNNQRLRNYPEDGGSKFL
jgi:hypothetical protein